VNKLVARVGRYGVQVPEDLRWEEASALPAPMATVKNDPHNHLLLRARLEFAYGDLIVPAQQPGRLVQTAPRSYVRRDAEAEQTRAREFHDAGFTADPYSQRDPEFPYELLISRMGEAARALLALGWQVRAKGKLYRQPGAFKLDLASGVDWFELNGGADYDGTFVPLPALLRALREKKDYVTLTDGSLGLLPKEWMDRLGPLAATGELEGNHIRFARRQAGLLDALLAARPEISFDAGVARVREELNSFRDVLPVDPPPEFRGDLRPYQREGLGWLYFLQRFGFGGCLADDMGLGKTVQVLALLESRRVLRRSAEPPPPSLVVVPRSLLFNWRREAERFTPQIRLLDHTGLARAKGTGHLNDYDVILTTYGTLRQDAVVLKDVEFDYLILDESQAVKNSSTQSAKAVRLLKGRHRLAMSGTPIENHVGELWSLFEFLNPGMMGSVSAFSTLTSDGVDGGGRTLLGQALRPFILRRTKAQVAGDLPARQEETLYCELPTKQRKLYDELRDHYRGALLGLVEKQGLGRSKIQILEALLRLRQAACHPGLLDVKAAGDESAKLTTLLPQLTELVEEGHKALVFSQFVSFLQIVKTQLKDTGIRYAYLDGKTRDREACVREFQEDPECKLFLISLKAGGLGLNLTSAGYVFLLDPWWNPAVEAQAIDRAHRIGQTQKVFAYRLIAKDTIEEKVLELQNKKRELADAIINADNSLLRGITREDLELLLM
jgi:SNF2 family DNA or RNA helicase